MVSSRRCWLTMGAAPLDADSTELMDVNADRAQVGYNSLGQVDEPPGARGRQSRPGQGRFRPRWKWGTLGRVGELRE